ncbi:MAG TPA: type II toxin-antitoxin system HicA family toxin [Terracidiphilus sp.]|nr:type II toxin-antitoxin system HicA family toxin [Terracidiphilus sp.]
MKTSEFVRWLKAQGVQFERFGKGSHLKVSLNGRSSVVPMHPSKEIAKGTLECIKKDLGLK